MPINLTATNHTLEVQTSTTTAVTVVSSFKDKSVSDETPGSDAQNISTATQTTVVAAPGASVQRQVEDCEILVTGSGTNQIIAQKDVGGTNFPMLNVLLGTGERAHFTSAFGWRVFDTFGREKFTMGFSLLKAPILLTSGTTHTPSIGCTAILLELWGGGGQGGGAATSSATCSVGSGGSCGGYSRKFLIGIPSTFTYAIGAGGSGGAAGATGGAGQTTSATINGVVYSAFGGPGGTVLAAGISVVAQPSPATATVSGTNCDDATIQPSGSAGIRFSGTQGFSGEGGEGQMGNNGQRRATISGGSAGEAATGIGSGGSGGATITTAVAGGNGANGAIRIWEFTS